MLEQDFFLDLAATASPCFYRISPGGQCGKTILVGEAFKHRWWGQFAEMDKFSLLINFLAVHSSHQEKGEDYFR